MLCKCGFCEYSKPTENGGWKCPKMNCVMGTYNLERILKLLSGKGY